MDVLNNFISLLGENTTAVIILSIIGIGLAGVTLILDYRNERRARDTFGIERRRLSEVNLKIRHEVRLAPIREEATPQGSQGRGAFMVLRMPMKNIGDGPIDILGMLASARQLTYAQWQKGIGARSRDVEWTDYQPSYWNDADIGGKVFAGISTTKFLINASDNFTRFAAKEAGIMRRMDAIHDVKALQSLGSVVVMHRVFAVARGYALGEILRQLGGGPPEPATNVRQELLQFQRLAQPDYRRWRLVQQALINLNRFAFRLAIFDMNKPEESADTLGILVNPDAWRMFLLHHWEFVDDVEDAAPHGYKDQFPLPPGGMQRASDIAREYFENLRLPDSWQDDDAMKRKITEAHERCAQELVAFVAAWGRLKEAIALCKPKPVNEEEAKGEKARGKARKNTPQEAYPMLIHTDKEYRERWLALMNEGYLVSKPFYRVRIDLGIVKLGGRRRKLTYKDIPDDPRVLEPYVMRTYYFLNSLDASELNRESQSVVSDR